MLLDFIQQRTARSKLIGERTGAGGAAGRGAGRSRQSLLAGCGGSSRLADQVQIACRRRRGARRGWSGSRRGLRRSELRRHHLGDWLGFGALLLDHALNGLRFDVARIAREDGLRGNLRGLHVARRDGSLGEIGEAIDARFQRCGPSRQGPRSRRSAA